MNIKRINRRGGALASKAFRNRRRRKWIAIVLTAIAIPALIFSGLMYLSYLPSVQIHEVKVEGTQTLSPAAIAAVAWDILLPSYRGFFSRNDVLFYPKDEILAAVAAFSPRIDAIAIGPSGLGTLTIVVHERTAEASWCDDVGHCMYVDQTGLLYENVSSSTATSSLPVFYGYTESNHVPYMYDALEFLDGLPREGFHPVSVTVDSEADAVIATTEGIDLKVDLQDDPAQTLDYIHTLVSDSDFEDKITSDSLLYIDLRFGNKVYYLPKKASKAGTSTLIEQKRGQ